MTLINNPPIARAKLDAKPAPIKLGEELPVFCERCGYSLHGLEQTRCEHCTLLQFHCPECGHHQPINTLRPAAQVLLGRIRGGWLAVVILFKLVLFGSLMMAWFAMGAGWSYTYDWNAYNAQMAGQQQAAAAAAAVGKPPPAAPVYQAPSMLPLQKLTWEVWLAF